MPAVRDDPPMTISIKLGAVALDCDDPESLGEFYSAVTGWPVVHRSALGVAVSGGGIALTMHKVADHRPATWPDVAVPKQIHLDFAVEDLPAAEARVLGLGAVKADHQPHPDKFRVFLDPAGHPFCLTTHFPAALATG
jgi:catechol 2,3-dioxygenase-like lactoylglutathione lyase family enzyme